MIWLTKEQVVYLHTELVKETGGLDGVRDMGMIESAITIPFSTFDNVEMFPSIREKIVRLAYGLVQNHPFIDGNKRIGAHVMLVLLAVNGITLEYTQEELSAIFLKLAAGEGGYEELLSWVNVRLKRQ